MSFAVAPKYAIAHTTVAYQEHGCEENEATNCARFTFEEETNQIEHNEHDMGLH